MKKIIIFILILTAITGGYFYWKQPKVNDVVVSEKKGVDFDVLPSDSIESWSWGTAYLKGSDLEKKALDEIKAQEDLLGKEDDDKTDYILYVGISNQYHYMGDGKKEFEYLKKAIKEDSENTGLAWRNVGVLMERLGAYNTALVAFENSVKAQPLPFYSESLIDFINRQFPNDKEVMDRALKLSNSFVGAGNTDE